MKVALCLLVLWAACGRSAPGEFRASAEPIAKESVHEREWVLTGEAAEGHRVFREENWLGAATMKVGQGPEGAELRAGPGGPKTFELFLSLPPRMSAEFGLDILFEERVLWSEDAMAGTSVEGQVAFTLSESVLLDLFPAERGCGQDLWDWIADLGELRFQVKTDGTVLELEVTDQERIAQCVMLD